HRLAHTLVFEVRLIQVDCHQDDAWSGFRVDLEAGYSLEPVNVRRRNLDQLHLALLELGGGHVRCNWLEEHSVNGHGRPIIWILLELDELIGLVAYELEWPNSYRRLQEKGVVGHGLHVSRAQRVFRQDAVKRPTDRRDQSRIRPIE